MRLLIISIGCIYLLLGIFIDGVVSEEWDILSILLWPILLVILLITFLVTGAYRLGQALRDRIGDVWSIFD